MLGVWSIIRDVISLLPTTLCITFRIIGPIVRVLDPQFIMLQLGGLRDLDMSRPLLMTMMPHVQLCSSNPLIIPSNHLSISRINILTPNSSRMINLLINQVLVHSMTLIKVRNNQEGVDRIGSLVLGSEGLKALNLNNLFLVLHFNLYGCLSNW